MAIETEFAELERLRPETVAHREGVRTSSRPSVYLAAVYAVLVVATVIAIVPFLYVISTSLKQTVALFAYPPEWIPKEPTLDNFASLVNDYPFARWTLNSLIVASVVTVIKVAID